MSTKFEAGKQYEGQFLTDSDSRFSMTVISRSAKMIKAIGASNPSVPFSFKIHFGSKGEEFIFPFGRYSMAPILSSERPIK